MFHGQKQRVSSEKNLLQRQVALAPHDKDLRLRLAEELIRTGGFDEALEQIRMVIRLDPNNLPARELRLYLDQRQSDWTQTSREETLGAG
jgi:thioredoxin-like negative regulator of GroEL